MYVTPVHQLQRQLGVRLHSVNLHSLSGWYNSQEEYFAFEIKFNPNLDARGGILMLAFP